MRQSAPATACPCGHGAFSQCCGRFLSAREQPATALELMRARYSAYVTGQTEFLLRTWHPAHRPRQLDDVAEPSVKWLELDVRRHQAIDADHAEVEFVARYREQGRGQRLHENSRFVRIDGNWFYESAAILETSRSGE